MEATLMTLEAKPEQQTESKKSREKEEDVEKKEEEENSYEYNLKKRQVDKFRELLQDKVYGIIPFWVTLNEIIFSVMIDELTQI